MCLPRKPIHRLPVPGICRWGRYCPYSSLFRRCWYFCAAVLSGKNSYVTVTGKPVAGLIRVTAGPVATWCFFAFCAVLCAAILMIIGVVFLFAFTVAFGADYTFTLQYFREGVVQSKVLLHSWSASMITAAATTILGIALAFLTIRKHFPGRTVMDFLAMLPVSLLAPSSVWR